MKAMKEIMEQRDLGYKRSRLIDRSIERTLETYPIAENPWMWLTLARTIKTTLTLIEEIAQKAIEDA